MKIKIAERLKPYSHTPGAACLIPGTCWEIEAFPTRIRIGKKIELKFKINGPVEEFTLLQDLEKNCVYVFGKAKEGFYRLKIMGSDAGFHLFAERVPSKGMEYDGSAHGILKAKEKIDLPAEVPFFLSQSHERLSLGNHRSQEWDAVQKRCDLKEMLPVLFFLGQKIPAIPSQPLKGTARLLQIPSDRNNADLGLESFLKASFTKIFIPRLFDDQYQGLAPEEPSEGNRFFLIQEGAKTVRNLFFDQTDRRLKFLPFLPISLDCGRMIHVKAKGVGELDFEWSKKLLRCVVIRAAFAGDVILELQNELKSFRVRSSLKEKGASPEKNRAAPIASRQNLLP